MELTRAYSKHETARQRLEQLAGRLQTRAQRADFGVSNKGTTGVARRLTESELAALAADYEAGMTVYELGAKYCIERRTVSNHLRKAGVKMRRRPISAGETAHAVRLYKSGHSTYSVGRQLGFDHGTIWHALKRAGVTMRDTHSRRR